jgi:3-oxoacyl-[acyl-carrier protein] reductase
MDLGLKGKVAAVAAASRGLGRATARALSLEGAAVALCGRDEGRIREAAVEISRETGAPTLPVVADVAVAADCRRFVELTVQEFGRLDILVTNTGGPRPGAFDAVDDDQWEEAFSTTLANVYHLARAAVPHMRKNRWGRIVNVASLSAKQPVDGLLLSNTFRPAIVGLAKTLSNELGADGILVNTLCPGYTRTDRLQEVADARAKAAGITAEKVLADLAKSVPLGRIAEPEEFAAVAAFLCSERASFLTGLTLAVDGGACKGLL